MLKTCDVFSNFKFERMKRKRNGVTKMKSFIQMTFSAIGAYLGWFLGGVDGLVHALVIFVVIDYLTGVMTAIVKRQLSSEIGFRGIFKKVMVFFLVGLGHLVDLYVLKNGGAIRAAVIFFYISNEGVSILENVAHLGLPFPEKLKQIISKIRE
jgi:toxin secretion/phage lysis holin